MCGVHFFWRCLPIAAVASVQCLELDTMTARIVVQSLWQHSCEHAYDAYSLSLERTIRSIRLTKMCSKKGFVVDFLSTSRGVSSGTVHPMLHILTECAL